MQQKAMPASEKANPFQSEEKNAQTAKHGKFFRMEQAQMDSPVSFARRSDSELVCFVVKAQHPATAAAPATGLGQESRVGRVQNQTLFTNRRPENRPHHTKVKGQAQLLLLVRNV